MKRPLTPTRCEKFRVDALLLSLSFLVLSAAFSASEFLLVLLILNVIVVSSYLLERRKKLCRELHRERISAQMPREIVWLGVTDDGKQAVSVVRHNGETFTATVPDDYHPADDKGMLLIKLANPEAFEDPTFLVDSTIKATYHELEDDV